MTNFSKINIYTINESIPQAIWRILLNNTNYLFSSKYDTIYTTWASSLLSKRYSKCVACISRIHLFNVTCSKLIKLFHQICIFKGWLPELLRYVCTDAVHIRKCMHSTMMYGNVLCMKRSKHDLLSYWYKWILSAADGRRIAGRE